MTSVRRGRRSRVALCLVVVSTLLLAGCDWPMFGYGPAHTGYNPFETRISTGNVASLVQAWTASVGIGVQSSPVVANGVVYIGANDDKLYAFDAAGVTNCASTPTTCAPLWTATTGNYVRSTPAVANGVVYVASLDGYLYAFDAAGNTNCSGTPKTCAPLWRAAPYITSNQSPPTVANGVVYAVGEGAVSAFDAAGTTNCSGIPKTCAPLWTAQLGGGTYASVAVANGVVYIGSTNLNGIGTVFAFDAATGATKWTATTVPVNVSSPAVANGILYVGSSDTKSSTDNKVYAFDAAGVINCSGTPTTCAPLWIGTIGAAIETSPAVANGAVYAGAYDGKVYAFDAAGNMNCSGTPTTCTPLWTAAIGSTQFSSPSVANGVIYVGSYDGNLSAFDVAGTTNCTGSPKTCAPLATITVSAGGYADSSPAVANGMVYIGGGLFMNGGGKLSAFGLEKPPPTPSRRARNMLPGGGPR